MNRLVLLLSIVTSLKKPWSQELLVIGLALIKILQEALNHFNEII